MRHTGILSEQQDHEGPLPVHADTLLFTVLVGLLAK